LKTAGARRKARELALSILFEADIGGAGPGAAMGNADHTMAVLMEEWGLTGEERAKLQAEIEHFGRRLADIYFRSAGEVDKFITRYSHEWALERMPGIDRNILRLALTELKFCPDVPTSAAINEAVELAKEYGGAESGKFVNGILGAFARDQHLNLGDGETAAPASEPGH
jgi:transcription antitermination protein NusB